ncbi:MAG: agmatinase family protein [Prevotellaceae bacterium]|jgi:agmatinase|nr:agmatinase family protein [Prevotellaceae bacterium]
MSLSFNPNAIGEPNGNYFALPYTLDEAAVALLSVPWDATASYGTGAHKAPEAIIRASAQVDLYDADVEDAWTIKIGTIPLDAALDKLNRRTRLMTDLIIAKLESGTAETQLAAELEAVNAASDKINETVYRTAKQYINECKLVAVVGGEHSAPFGLLKALDEKYEAFGILHIDAHADLRKAYEGFTYSHASIMYNVLHQLTHVTNIVQVAVRDYCDDEATLMETDPRVTAFTDAALQHAAFNGTPWAKQSNDIIAALPANVYISFDIDGLMSENCPHTGTPVPGGLTYNQAVYLLKALAQSGKHIIGFDLCEVAPAGNSEWDANVGARLLFKLCCYAHGTLKNNNF